MFPVGDQMRTDGQRHSEQLNAKAGGRKGGLRGSFEQRDCRQDNDPTRNLQEESEQSHENAELL